MTLTTDNNVIHARHGGILTAIVALPASHQARVAARIGAHREINAGALTRVDAVRLGTMISLITTEAGR